MTYFGEYVQRLTVIRANIFIQIINTTSVPLAFFHSLPLPLSQAYLAESYGCKALLIYSDPQECAPKGTQVYPYGPSLPEFGIQRGTLSRQDGDLLTPGIPAIRKASLPSVNRLLLIENH